MVVVTQPRKRRVRICCPGTFEQGIGRLVEWLVGWLVVCLFVCLVGWLVDEIYRTDFHKTWRKNEKWTQNPFKCGWSQNTLSLLTCCSVGDKPCLLPVSGGDMGQCLRWGDMTWLTAETGSQLVEHVWAGSKWPVQDGSRRIRDILASFLYSGIKFIKSHFSGHTTWPSWMLTCDASPLCNAIGKYNTLIFDVKREKYFE